MADGDGELCATASPVAGAGAGAGAGFKAQVQVQVLRCMHLVEEHAGPSDEEQNRLEDTSLEERWGI